MCDRPAKETEKGVTAEIEVTPEMTKIGVMVFCEWAEICPPDLLVPLVYRAMRAAETSAGSAPGTGLVSYAPV